MAKARKIDTSGGGSIVLLNVACDASVFVGAAVRMDVSGTAFNAVATGLTTANVIGVVQAKPTSILCDIRVTGVTPGVLAGLDVTKEYFLSASAAGSLTTSPPTGSGEIIIRVGQPFSGTRLLVNKGTPLERH